MLEFDTIYMSQTYINIEIHAGSEMHHFIRYFISFYENGNYKISTTIGIENPNVGINRLNKEPIKPGKKYKILKNIIEFEIGNRIFKGQIKPEAIVGMEYEIGEYKEGFVKEKDEIFVKIKK